MQDGRGDTWERSGITKEETRGQATTLPGRREVRERCGGQGGDSQKMLRRLERRQGSWEGRGGTLTFQGAGEDTDSTERPLPCSGLLKAIRTRSLRGQHLGPTWLLRWCSLRATRGRASAWEGPRLGRAPENRGKPCFCIIIYSLICSCGCVHTRKSEDNWWASSVLSRTTCISGTASRHRSTAFTHLPCHQPIVY